MLDGQARRPSPVPFIRECHCLTVDEELPTRGEHRGEDSQRHYGPSDRGDVASEFLRTGGEPGVCGKAID